MKYQQGSLLAVLLLMCGDVESCPGPDSLTREQFGSFLNKGVKFVHQNIRGLSSNFDMLQEFVAAMQWNDRSYYTVGDALIKWENWL